MRASVALGSVSLHYESCSRFGPGQDGLNILIGSEAQRSYDGPEPLSQPVFISTSGLSICG